MRLTDRVHELLHEIGRRTADATVAIGKHLAQIQARLDHGQWLAWISDNVPFSSRTASGYMALAEWAAGLPDEFARLRHVGPTKLMLIAARPRPQVRGLKAGTPMNVPGVDGKKTIEAMTVVELGRILGDLKAPAPPKVPIGKVVQDVRTRVESLREATDVMAKRAREVDAEAAAEIREELVEVLAVLDKAFG